MTNLSYLSYSKPKGKTNEICKYMRILIVEDQKELRLSLKEAIESECFVVDAAEDGERGAFLACTNDYDLIILDNNLPKKSGPQVCAEVRKQGKSVPILILSVEAAPPKKVELLNMGADDYLTKPFSLEELMARIRALLRRPKLSETEILKAGDLTLDVKRHLVFRGKREIYLTKKEFMLLEYLMKNQDAVVSRGGIMEHVWDVNADPFSNTIETHILSLRKKIASDKKKFIHTVPGRGYKLTLKST